MRSRLFSSRRQGPGRQGTWLASRELLLTSGVPSNDPKRVGFCDQLLGLSDIKALSRGYLSLGSQSKAIFGN